VDNNSNRTFPTELSIATNYFRFSHLNPSKNCFYQYSLEIEGYPEESKRIRKAIYGSVRPKINEILGKTIFNNTMLFSKNFVDDQSLLIFNTNYREQNYKLIIKFTNKLKNESFEALSLYKRFFNTLIAQLQYVEIKKSFFDARKAIPMSEFRLDILSGFYPTVSQLKKGILLNLNVTNKIIRNETALELIYQLKQKFTNKNDFVREAQIMIQNLCVITKYNGETNFVVNSICFEKTPRDVFEVKIRKGSGPLRRRDKRIEKENEDKENCIGKNQNAIEFEIKKYSYLDYYYEKYQLEINPDQPLLKVINKRRNDQEIFLIPELCFLTGLTENMRANFNMMKEIDKITKGNPTEKLRETRDLIKKIMETPGARKAIEDWEITLESEVLRLEGNRIPTGNILMGQNKDGSGRNRIDIDFTPDLDRKIQNEMYSQPALNNWIVK